MMLRRIAILLPGLVLGAGGNTQAQEVSVPSVTVANPGGFANPLKLDTDRYDQEQRQKTRTRNRAATQSCSADALPVADRRRMEAEYVRRAKSDGKASADAWVQEQGKRFRQKLIAEGLCDAPAGGKARTASAAERRTKKTLTGKNGRPCTKTRIEMRPVAGFGGAMTMGQTPVCAD